MPAEGKRSKYFAETLAASQPDEPTAKRAKLLSWQSDDRRLSAGRSKPPTGERLARRFFDVPCEELARKLLGTIIVRKSDEHGCLRARIVETEAYLGGDDRGAHSYNGKRTDRIEAMYMLPGKEGALSLLELSIVARGLLSTVQCVRLARRQNDLHPLSTHSS